MPKKPRDLRGQPGFFFEIEKWWWKNSYIQNICENMLWARQWMRKKNAINAISLISLIIQIPHPSITYYKRFYFHLYKLPPNLHNEFTLILKQGRTNSSITGYLIVFLYHQNLNFQIICQVENCFIYGKKMPNKLNCLSQKSNLLRSCNTANCEVWF